MIENLTIEVNGALHTRLGSIEKNTGIEYAKFDISVGNSENMTRTSDLRIMSPPI